MATFNHTETALPHFSNTFTTAPVTQKYFSNDDENSFEKQ